VTAAERIDEQQHAGQRAEPHAGLDAGAAAPPADRGERVERSGAVDPAGAAADDAAGAADDAVGLPEGGGDPVLPAGATLVGACEALLLIANDPLELGDLTRLFGGCSWVPVRRALRELQRRYREQPSGLELVEVAKGWRLTTQPAYAPLCERLGTIEREERLTRAQLEVLAAIAYRQPVRRASVDALRGADSTGALKALIDKGLVRVAGRADQLGRPLLYGTTRLFLERFGLKDASKLPRPGAAGG
jgi:segregation and condensation protein B